MSRRPTLSWFVTYQPRGRHPGAGYTRMSEQFASEQDAKAFARARLADGPDITAGTINPHQPKRFIGSAQIVDWLNEHPEG